jgi:hypothetical protein
MTKHVLAHSDMHVLISSQILVAERHLICDRTMGVLQYVCKDSSADNGNISYAYTRVINAPHYVGNGVSSDHAVF